MKEDLETELMSVNVPNADKKKLTREGETVKRQRLSTSEGPDVGGALLTVPSLTVNSSVYEFTV